MVSQKRDKQHPTAKAPTTTPDSAPTTTTCEHSHSLRRRAGGYAAPPCRRMPDATHILRHFGRRSHAVRRESLAATLMPG